MLPRGARFVRVRRASNSRRRGGIGFAYSDLGARRVAPAWADPVAGTIAYMPERLRMWAITALGPITLPLPHRLISTSGKVGISGRNLLICPVCPADKQGRVGGRSRGPR